MPKRFVLVEVDEVVKETEAAFLFLLPSGDEVWVPKSQLEDPDDYEIGQEQIEVSMTRWIAEQKGIECD